MLQLLSLYLNWDKELQFKTASDSEIQTFTDLLLNSLPLLFTLKHLILMLWPGVLELEISNNVWTSRSINWWKCLKNVIKSTLIRRHSKLSIFLSFKRSLHERCCRPCNFLLKRRWMFSNFSIRPSFDGDQTE